MSSGTGPIELNHWPGIHDAMMIAKAADLIIPRPIKFERIIDLHVARTRGLDVPPTPIARLDELIE
jgi:hypothetical protein